MKSRSLPYSTVQLLFGGIITLLIIPTGGMFVLIRGVWRVMDRILEFIEKKEKKNTEEREEHENDVQEIN
ncbi:MAG: hypothetical protein K2K57_14065 [Oscillospiraceae bacterium]|nr:hypothetical protein [Oscillospiraceae bacterium]